MPPVRPSVTTLSQRMSVVPNSNITTTELERGPLTANQAEQLFRGTNTTNRRSKKKAGLSTPQIRVLLALSRAYGPLSRAKLSQRIGNKTQVVVGRALGYDDPLKRQRFENSKDGGFRPSLLTLGYVRKIVLDIDGEKENAYELTDTGKEAIEQLGEITLSRTLNDTHAIHRSRVESQQNA